MEFFRAIRTIFRSPEVHPAMTNDPIDWKGLECLIDVEAEAKLRPEIDCSSSIRHAPTPSKLTPKHAGLDLANGDLFDVFMVTINRQASS